MFNFSKQREIRKEEGKKNKTNVHCAFSRYLPRETQIHEKKIKIKIKRSARAKKNKMRREKTMVIDLITSAFVFSVFNCFYKNLNIFLF